MKNYVANQLIGSETSEDENTLFGYANLWVENKACNTAGVILGQYRKYSAEPEDYLKTQSALDAMQRQ